jgi:hypothetical protein
MGTIEDSSTNIYFFKFNILVITILSSETLKPEVLGFFPDTPFYKNIVFLINLNYYVYNNSNNARCF